MKPYVSQSYEALCQAYEARFKSSVAGESKKCCRDFTTLFRTSLFPVSGVCLHCRIIPDRLGVVL